MLTECGQIARSGGRVGEVFLVQVIMDSPAGSWACPLVVSRSRHDIHVHILNIEWLCL